MLAVGFALFLTASLVPPAQAAPLRSFYELTVIINDQASPSLAFTFDLASPFNGTNPVTEAAILDLTVGLDDSLVADGAVNGTWSASLTHANGDVWINMTARISAAALENITASPASTVFATMSVHVVYTDDQGARPRSIDRVLTFPLNYRPPAPASPLFAVLLGLGGAGMIGLVLYVGRRARLEDLYLMHDSGLLIRHWSKSNGVGRDSDILSGMLIVLQEFVRDSFREPHGTLEHLRFGPKQVVMSRGRHTVLAAVVRGRYLNGLPRRLREALAEFEASYSDILPHWNGNMDRFPRVDALGVRLLHGRRNGAAA